MDTRLSEELAAAADAYRHATATLDNARERLRAAVVDADDAGARQVDIIAAAGAVWGREQIRRILRRSNQ